MKFYTIRNDKDGNDFFQVEGESAECAALTALSELGWNLLEKKLEDRAKFQVQIAVNVASFAAVEVEAENEIEANRIVAESIEKDGWESPYWQEANDWDTDWQNAEELRVVGWEGEP